MVRVVLCMFFLVVTLNCLAGETEKRLFRPFTEGANHALLKVKEILKGSCYKQSKKMRRKDAWQCRTENLKFDPCFIKPGNNKTLFCPESPWNGDSTVIEADIVANNDLFDLVNMADHLPWVLLLDNGITCKRSENIEIFDQQPVEYLCQDKSFLFGRLQRCRAKWSMLLYDGKASKTIEIQQAWF